MENWAAGMQSASAKASRRQARRGFGGLFSVSIEKVKSSHLHGVME
jgi:hypothetical protein